MRLALNQYAWKQLESHICCYTYNNKEKKKNLLHKQGQSTEAWLHFTLQECHAVPWEADSTFTVIEQTPHNNAALSLIARQKKVGRAIAAAAARRNESAVITAACKCIRASRRQIDFAISDWPSVITLRGWQSGDWRRGSKQSITDVFTGFIIIFFFLWNILPCLFLII